MRRWVIVVALAIVAGVLTSSVSPLSRLAAQGDPAAATRSVPLVEGWNLVAWTGNDTSVEEALGDTLVSVSSINTFNAATQSFGTFTVDGPVFLNSLDMIPAGAGVWLLAATAATWEQPLVTTAREVPLVAGFNLVGWTGASGAMADAVDGLGDALTTAFLWDAPNERFLTYGPAAPPFLNTAETVAYGDGLWVLMSAPARWTQGDGEPESAVTTADGLELTHSLGLRVSIPAGAISPGLVVTATPVPPTALLPDGATPIGTAYEISVDEVLGRPATVRFPLPAGADPERIVVFRIDGDETMALGAEVVGDEIVATTPGFSLLGPALTARRTAAKSQAAAEGFVAPSEQRSALRINGPLRLPFEAVATYTASEFFVSDPSRLRFNWSLAGTGAIFLSRDGRSATVTGAIADSSVVLSVVVVDTSDGLKAFDSIQITVTPSESLGVSVTGPESVPVSRRNSQAAVTFTVQVNGSAGEYGITWAYGDTAGGSERSALRRFELPAHGYERPGFHQVSVVVTDESGKRATASFSIEVRPLPLQAVLAGPSSVDYIPGVDGLKPGGGEATYTLAWSGGIDPVTIDWTIPEGALVTLEDDRGTAADVGARSMRFVRFSEEDVYLVVVEVVDGFGNRLRKSVLVRVAEPDDVARGGALSVTPSVEGQIRVGEPVELEVAFRFPNPLEDSRAVQFMARVVVAIGDDVTRLPEFQEREGSERPFLDFLVEFAGVEIETDLLDRVVEVRAPLRHTFQTIGIVPVRAVWVFPIRLETGEGVTASVVSDQVDVVVVANVNGLWGSGLECEVEEPGFEFSWTVSVNQERDGEVSGVVFFHACPGGGRVSYQLSGQVDPDSRETTLTLFGTRRPPRGALGDRTPPTATFVITQGAEPEPNFVKRHDLAVAIAPEPRQAFAERPLEFEYTLTNNGPDVALDAFLRLDWSGVEATVTGASSECDFEQGRLFCRSPELKVGKPVTFSVTLTPIEDGTLTVEANVGATGADPVFPNNRATVSKEILASP